MTSTVASVTSTGSAPTTTPSCAVTWEIPTSDAACAVHPSGNASDVLKQCCGVAAVQSYDGGCAEYCLAQGQDVGTLYGCLQSNGIGAGGVFCNDGNNATATAAIPSSTSSSTSSGTASGTSASSTSTHGAAAPAAKISAGGVTVFALLFCSALFGALA